MDQGEKRDKIIFLKDKVLHQDAGGFVFYESETKHLYVALLKNERGKFVIPKGHIHQGEAPASAATREIKEELGLTGHLSPIGFVGQSRFKYKDYDENKMHFKRVNVFLFFIRKMALLSPQKEEGYIEAKWLKVEDALKKIAFDKVLLQKAIDAYRAYFNQTPVSKNK
jgi:8-oxo-dGTP pyrophosphatase MutT (NUDIX family)